MRHDENTKLKCRFKSITQVLVIYTVYEHSLTSQDGFKKLKKFFRIILMLYELACSTVSTVLTFINLNCSTDQLMF